MDQDPRDENGNTPLHLAAHRGDLATVQALLACGAPLEAANANYQTALEIAVEQRKWLIVKALAKAGADINNQGHTVFWKEGQRTIKLTPLAGLIYGGRLDEVEHFLLLNPELEAETRLYVDSDITGTAVHAAALANEPEILEKLLTLGAKHSPGTSRGFDTPLHLAAANGSGDCAAILLRHGASAKIKNIRDERPADMTDDPELKKMLQPK